jgi:glutamate-1-semialdehyde 2,1-aminomutase
LGHDNAAIREAIIQTVQDGTSFGTPTPYGNKIGDLIINNHRFLEKIRFVSSGTEAVMSAIRLARGFTGRSKIVKFEGCYHGHVDSLMVKAGSGLVTFGVSSSAGVTSANANDTIVIDLNDLQALKDLLNGQGHEIAAVIIEPIPANNGLLLQDHNYLSWIRKICDDHGVLLIFDEVISGFRVGFEGASGYYNIGPDLITFGKIVGGGMPVGAYGGRADIMSMVSPEGPVYQAGTLSANPVTLSAGIAALQQLLQTGVYESMEIKTKRIADEINTYYRSKNYNAGIVQIASIFWLKFSRDRIFTASQIKAEDMNYFKVIHHELLQRGIYLGPSGYEVGFVSAAHSDDDISYFIATMKEVSDIAFS